MDKQIPVTVKFSARLIIGSICAFAGAMFFWWVAGPLVLTLITSIEMLPDIPDLEHRNIELTNFVGMPLGALLGIWLTNRFLFKSPNITFLGILAALIVNALGLWILGKVLSFPSMLGMTGVILVSTLFVMTGCGLVSGCKNLSRRIFCIKHD